MLACGFIMYVPYAVILSIFYPDGNLENNLTVSLY